jgi:hypothetical protein
MVAFTYRDRVWSGVALAIVIAKYSFLPIALCFLVQRRWKSISIAIAASILSWLLFTAMVHSEDALGTLRGPLEVSRTAVADGVGDLMSALELIMGLDRSNFALYWAGFIVAFILTLLIIPRLKADQWMHALAISGVISLLCFKHLLHDFVFLLPVLAILGSVTKKKQIVAICVVFTQWFGLSMLDQIGVATTTATATTLSFCSMCALLWAIIPVRLVTVSRGATKEQPQT